MDKSTEFRFWLQTIWQEYCIEHESYNSMPPLSMADYFRTYKYWLKREFQYRKSKQPRPQSNLVFDTIFDDKLDSTGITLLSEQNRLIKTLKD